MSVDSHSRAGYEAVICHAIVNSSASICSLAAAPIISAVSRPVTPLSSRRRFRSSRPSRSRPTWIRRPSSSTTRRRRYPSTIPRRCRPRCRPRGPDDAITVDRADRERAFYGSRVVADETPTTPSATIRLSLYDASTSSIVDADEAADAGHVGRIGRISRIDLDPPSPSIR
ncbi:hypothetical protein D8S78_05100 [Natrialba swarupiae]|nr:hypothetical protein [Natrialba swarupiae]